MNRIQVNAKFANVSSSNLAEFKKVAAHALEIAKTEPGVLQYDWFFNQDETACVVRERYADSDAVLAHLGVVGELLGKIIELGGGVEIDVFGSPSAVLVQAAEALRPRVYSYFQGK